MSSIDYFREEQIRVNKIILNRMDSRKEESKQGYIKIIERCGDNKLIVEISGDHSEVWHTAPYLADLFGVYINTINGKVAKIDNNDIVSLDDARRYRVFKSDKGVEIQRAEYGLKAIVLLAYMIDNHRSRVLIEWIESRITAKVETESFASSKQVNTQHQAKKMIVSIIIMTSDSPCLN